MDTDKAGAARSAKTVKWLGRSLLAAVLLFAAAGVVDPKQRLAAVGVRGDRVDHCLLSYAIMLALVASFPRARSWLLAAIVVGIGAALEAAQGLGLFAGDAQLGDLAADLVGVLLVLAPTMAGKWRALANH